MLILGGRSDIGLAIAHAFAARGHAVHLAARDAASLEEATQDIRLRHGVDVTLHEFDVLDTAAFEDFTGGLDPLPQIAVSVVGMLGDPEADAADPARAARVMRTNYEGPALILEAVAARFARRGHGTIVGISSVAGDRGRASNYLYGSAKAGFTAYLSGMRNRLARRGVHVVTVKPGFVATRMTEGMDLSPRLTAQPEEVAQAVVRAVERGRDVVYVRRLWWPIMTIIRAIPEPIFKKTSL